MVIVHRTRCQHCTARYFLKPLGINRTLAGIFVHKTANQISMVNLACVFIFEFVQAAFSATVTQRFPLLLRHLAKALALPERDLRNHEFLSPGLVRKSTI